MFCAVLLPLLAQPACGSEDNKKKAPSTPYTSGGEGGAGNGSSGNPSDTGGAGDGNGVAGAGNAGTAGTPAAGGQGAAGRGDAGNGNSTAGAGANAGAGGGNDGPQCPAGTADCDDDPLTCEADVTKLTQCGECNVACSQANGTTICGESGCEVTSCMAGYGDCNATGTDGCESALNTADNCGFCGRDCGTQACNAQTLCDATLVGSAGAAYRWARTTDALYRLTGNTPSYGLTTDYTLTRTPLNGAAEVVMHTDGKAAGGLAVDDANVYWAVNGTPAGVLKKAHGAAAAATPLPFFETPSIPVQMTIRGNYMYYMNFAGAIYRRLMTAAPTDDGDEIVSAAEVKGAGVFNLHQDFVTTPTALYWVVLPSSGNMAFIRTAPLAGGTASDVPGAITNSFKKLSVVGEDLYWVRVTGSAFDGAYHYSPSVATQALVLQANLNGVQAAGEYLYLLGGGANTLYRAPIAGGNSLKLGTNTVGNESLYALDFAGTDATRVFVLTSFTHGSGFYGAYKVFGYPL